MAAGGGGHDRGRLTGEIRDRALEVLRSGANWRRWQDAEPRVRARRAAVLAKVGDQLAGPQPARKPVRRPARHVTALKPGDVLAFQAPSGRFHLLAVRAVVEGRHGAFPFVRLLDFHRDHLPAGRELAKLRDQRAGRGSDRDRPAEPWWSVDSVVLHRRRRDFADYGFKIMGQVPAPPETEPIWAIWPRRACCSRNSRCCFICVCVSRWSSATQPVCRSPSFTVV